MEKNMSEYIYTKISKQEKIQLIVQYMLKLLKKKNTNFYSCITLQLPDNGMISSLKFPYLFRKFLRKIQRNQFYIAVFEINEQTRQLEMKILISENYSDNRILFLRQLWYGILRKENNLLTLKEFENCLNFKPIVTNEAYLTHIFRLENSKEQIPSLIGTAFFVRKRGFRSSFYPGIFYSSNVFGDICYKLRVLLVQQRKQ